MALMEKIFKHNEQFKTELLIEEDDSYMELMELNNYELKL